MHKSDIHMERVQSDIRFRIQKNRETFPYYLLNGNKSLTPAIQAMDVVMNIIGLFCIHTDSFIGHDVSYYPCKDVNVMLS